MKKLSDTGGLEKLGKDTTYVYDGADKALLERFPNPMQKGPGLGAVNMVSPEFTSLCPLTGQPDFATIVVDYVPNEWCVESKAWKMYLGSFRDFGEFHESCVRRMTNDLIQLLDPWTLRVTGQFTPRGGIPFWPTVSYNRPEVNFDFRDIPENLDDRCVFFVGESVFANLEAASTPEAMFTVDGEIVGSALVAEYEAATFDEMARKYSSTHHKFKDRNRIKKHLEEAYDEALKPDTMVTVVWFKSVVMFDDIEENEVVNIGDKDGS